MPADHALDDATTGTYDVVVLGTGSGGEVVAGELAGDGWSVAAVEERLVGGECPYLACVPSKALLLAAQEHRRRLRLAVGGGTDGPALEAGHAAAWQAAVERRDTAAAHRDDGDAAQGLAEAGVEVVRGRGEVVAPGVVAVGQRRLRWRRALVVGTGSAPSAPPVDGLGNVPTWTSDEALGSAERPRRLLVLGGGPVGCELAQAYASFGVEVVLVEASDRVLPSEQPVVGEVVGQALRGLGVDVRVGAPAERAERAEAPGVVLHLGDGATVRGDRVLLAGGRRPQGDGLGLELLGVRPDDGALRVDARCRVLTADGPPLPDVFAVGDVTGALPYTHTANHQARHVADHLRGRGRDVDLRGVPRTVLTDPPVLCAGLTSAQAEEAGRRVRVEGLDLDGTARGFLEREAPGRVELVVDAATGELLGAAAVGPGADSWGGELALAVRLGLPVGVLADVVHAFPTWSEALHPAARRLAAT